MSIEEDTMGIVNPPNVAMYYHAAAKAHEDLHIFLANICECLVDRRCDSFRFLAI